LDEDRVIALIPARAGSKRVRDKNVRPLGGHPLLAYSIAAARQCGVFSAVLVSTDSEEYARVAAHYGAEVPFLRPVELAGDLSPDIEWIDFTLRNLERGGRGYDFFSILRPTSPFRLPATIQRAWATFRADPGADSLRAVEKCREHPGKMWLQREGRLLPLLPFQNGSVPWHSSAYQALPEIFVQNASLEIARTQTVFRQGSIAGTCIVAFLSHGYEGFDVNRAEDWDRAEKLVATQAAALPSIREAPYRTGSSA
jgi:CMP-N,N'-diacetyllegionaminic acid synthase